MYDYLLGALESFIRYGMSPTALVVALVALFRTKYVRRLVGRRAPWLFKDEADVLNYQSRQKRIESKLDALMSAGGVSWDAGYLTGKIEPKETNGAQKKSLLPRVAYAPVIFIKHFIRSKVIYLSRQRRMKMRSKFLSRKFLLALATGVLVILNDGLDMGLKTDTIMYVVGIVAVWITGESAVDLAKKPVEVKDVTYTSREDSEGA